jgi:hypothetical protein
MTEISYITQNGEQINLKDAAGREMLAQKQPKLKAGKGITISPAGVISAVAGSDRVKTIVAEDVEVNEYSSWTDFTFDVVVDYIGNPALISKPHAMLSESASATYNFEDGYMMEIGIKNAPDFNSWLGHTFNAAIKEEMLKEPATDDDFLIIFPRKAITKSIVSNTEGHDVYVPAGVPEENNESDLSVVYIYFKDIGKEDYPMNAYTFFEYADDSEHDIYSMESSYSWSYINSDGEVDYITSPSEYSILAMMIKDLLK